MIKDCNFSIKTNLEWSNAALFECKTDNHKPNPDVTRFWKFSYKFVITRFRKIITYPHDNELVFSFFKMILRYIGVERCSVSGFSFVSLV